MTHVKIFGDSILEGVYFDGRYHKTKDKIKVDNYEIDNYSRMGNTIEDGIKNIKKHLDECDENTVAILEYGGNDCNYQWDEVSATPEENHLCAVEPTDYKEKLMYAINLLKEKGTKVIIASPIPIATNKFMDFISNGLSYNNILKWLGDKNQLFKWQEYYAKMNEKIALMTDSLMMPLRYMFLQDGYENLLCVDGIHPTVEGHEKIHRYIEGYIAQTC